MGARRRRARPARAAHSDSGRQLFFQKIDMGRQATDLGVQILQLALVGGLHVGQRIPPLEHVRQPLEGRLLPVTQDSGMHAILRCELAERFGFLQQFQNDLSFEGSGVRLFHTAILPNSGVLIVQILGSTITRCETCLAYRTHYGSCWFWGETAQMAFYVEHQRELNPFLKFALHL